MITPFGTTVKESIQTAISLFNQTYEPISYSDFFHCNDFAARPVLAVRGVWINRGKDGP